MPETPITVTLRWGTARYTLSKKTISGTTIDGKEFTIENVENDALADWLGGAYVQDAFPGMSADDREILISGLSPQKFDELAPEDEEGEELAKLFFDPEAKGESEEPRWDPDRRVPRSEDK